MLQIHTSFPFAKESPKVTISLHNRNMLLWAGAIKNIKSFLGQSVAGMRMGVLELGT
jgi:hypothetical protein